jgi:hypothetical protein
MTSHEYAEDLLKTARFLLGKPEFDVNTNQPRTYFYYWTDKAAFVAAARALGSGSKEVSNDYFDYTPNDTLITARASRDAVCKKVQEAKWECIPLLSTIEAELLGTVAEVPNEEIPF